jgi:chemotaxis protein methyltransferase CheR
MTAAVTEAALAAFRLAIGRHLGLLLDDTRLAQLASVLQGRLEATGKSPEQYVLALESYPLGAAEILALARELTIGETYFFRNSDQFRALAEVALPDRIAARSQDRRLSLLSAGCASGEEAYSLAIVARDCLPDPAWQMSILAVDANADSLARAASARYSPWSLRETPPEVQRRWLRPEGRDFVLDRVISSAVRFEHRNLMAEDAGVWPAETYDVVFCRNMLMYFTPEAMQTLVARITHSLVPGGYLYLGHAETLRGISVDYHLRHTHGTFYYQRKDLLDGRRVAAAPAWRPAPPMATAAPAEPDWATSWVETIQRASQRVERLTRSALPSRSLEPVDAPATGLAFALELLKMERFSEALALVPPPLRPTAADADLLLLRAVLLAHSGKLDDAEQACRALLDRDELNAAAHYLLALCREGVGDRRGALEHDQVAVYLGPSFAMPRLHLGLLARRNGERETARRELEQAMVLLEQEDASRVLLFGGGFSRAALVALCRAELVASGGNP